MSSIYNTRLDGEIDIRDAETNRREGQLTLVCESLKPPPSPFRDPSQPLVDTARPPPLARHLNMRGGGSRPIPRPSSHRADHPTTSPPHLHPRYQLRARTLETRGAKVRNLQITSACETEKDSKNTRKREGGTAYSISSPRYLPILARMTPSTLEKSPHPLTQSARWLLCTARDCPPLSLFRPPVTSHLPPYHVPSSMPRRLALVSDKPPRATPSTIFS